jgi:hypothetical protein
VLFELACALLSAAMQLCSAATRPAEAHCPPGSYVNGVTPIGVYECRRAPGGDPLYDGAGGYPDRAVDRPGWYQARIYCPRGQHPIVVLARHDSDARFVACER